MCQAPENRLVSMRRAIYRDAVLDRLVGMSLVIKLALPSHVKKRVVPLTVAEVRKLVAAMPERNRAMVIVQATCGLRIGELLALRVEDIDFLPALCACSISSPLSRKFALSRRHHDLIPLPKIAGDALAAHLSKFPAADDGTMFVTRKAIDAAWAA